MFRTKRNIMNETEPYNVNYVRQLSLKFLFKLTDHLMLTISVIGDTVKKPSSNECRRILLGWNRFHA